MEKELNRYFSKDNIQMIKRIKKLFNITNHKTCKLKLQWSYHFTPVSH